MADHGEMIVIKKKIYHAAGHHGGAWKIAFADFMTAMMAFFLVLWIINATDKDTKSVIARYFNPVRLENPARARKGVHGVDASKVVSNETTGDQSPGVEPGPMDSSDHPQKGAGPSAPAAANIPAKKDQKPKTTAAMPHPEPLDAVDVKPTMSETALFSDPYQSLDKIVGGRSSDNAAPSTDTGDPSASTREAGATSIEAFRDPFKPIGPGSQTDPVSLESDSPPPPLPGQKADLEPQKGEMPASIYPSGPQAALIPVPNPDPNAKAGSPVPTTPNDAAAAPPLPKDAPTPVALAAAPPQAKDAWQLPPPPKDGAAPKETPPAPKDAPQPMAKDQPAPTAKAGQPPTPPATPAPIPTPATTAPQSQGTAASRTADLMKELQQQLGPFEKSETGPGIAIEATKEGLLISLTDKLTFSMFAIGSAEPRAEVIKAMAAVAAVVKTHPDPIVVRGHTDARQYKAGTYDNWRLSSDRAQMAYYMLTRAGVPEARIQRIEGHADHALRDPAHPLAAENRRIEILIRETKS